MTAGPTRPVAIAWAEFQPRTIALATALGGEAVFVTSRLSRRLALAPFRYLTGAVRTWRFLERRQPSCVIVITPPVVAPLVAGLWCRLRRRPLVIDCHTDTFHSRRWRWAIALHRRALVHSRAALVHTEEALKLALGWGAPGLLLPDDLPEPGDAEPRQPATGITVLVAGSLDENEPILEVLAAARLVPEVEFRLTGDPGRLPTAVRKSAAPNVVFTGFLPYPTFLGEMLGADAVGVFSTDPHIMNRAAFEAIGLGRPLVLSDLAGLRERFGAAALLATNRPEAIADTMRRALTQSRALEERSRQLAHQLRQRHALAVDRLRGMLSSSSPRVSRSRVLRITTHLFPADSIVRRDVLELVARGFQVDVICAAGPSRDDAVAAIQTRLRVYQVPIHHRRSHAIRYLYEYGAFFLAALGLATVLGLRRRYAAVQVDNLPDLLVFSAAMPRWRGARVVFNMYELTPEMVAARFRGRLGTHLSRAARLIEAAATRWADHVIVVSRPCRDVLLSRGVPEARMSVVLNTTPWNESGPVRNADHSEAQVLITHTTLVERYGVHVAIQALSLLCRSWPGLTLRVVGGGEQLPALVRMATDLGVRGMVVFTGLLPLTRTLVEVSRATLGIVAVIADGYGELLLPTKLLEYARLGVPAVCSRLPAIEAYFPSDAVAYAAAGNAEDLATQIDRLLRHPEAAEQLAHRASEIARELAWERVRDAYLGALGLADSPSALATSEAGFTGREAATSR
jgi:glycosyltransferase involved in cell wall biosynthesis